MRTSRGKKKNLEICNHIYFSEVEAAWWKPGINNRTYQFKVCKSVHHHKTQINQPTRCNNFSSLLLDVYVQLSMFRASSRSSSVAQQLQWQPLVLSLGRGGGSAVGRGQASRPDHDQQHCHHHAPTVKPVVELLMMGVRTPKTCWAVHKRQVISLRNCCILLVDLFVNYSF